MNHYDDYDDGKYAEEKIKQGEEYQDYVTEYLCVHGMTLTTFTSAKYQYKKGENIFGAEIKHDDNHKRTGNLYIEVKERRKTCNNYVDSGIFRKDNSWLYIIGNYDIAYIFFKIQLQKLTERYKVFEIKRKTSKGFLIPGKDIKRYCGKILDFKK